MFRREGADIHSDAVVSLSQAILGGTVRTPGITEHVLLNVSLLRSRSDPALLSFVVCYFM